MHSWFEMVVNKMYRFVLITGIGLISESAFI